MTTLNDIKQWYYTPKAKSAIPKKEEKEIQRIIRILDTNTGDKKYFPEFKKLKEIYESLTKNK